MGKKTNFFAQDFQSSSFLAFIYSLIKAMRETFESKSNPVVSHFMIGQSCVDRHRGNKNIYCINETILFNYVGTARSKTIEEVMPDDSFAEIREELKLEHLYGVVDELIATLSEYENWYKALGIWHLCTPLLKKLILHGNV